jgi:hypothetical protein
VATYTLKIQHSEGFTQTVTLEIGASPSSELAVDLASPTSFAPPGGQTTLTLTDLHDLSFTDRLRYTIPLTVTGGDFVKTTNVIVLVNGTQTYLPVIFGDEN